MQITKPTQRQAYKITNWSAYNKSLIARGSINLWYAEDLESQWYDTSEATGPGRSLTYSDNCIRICLIVKSLYKLTYRQVEGHLESLFQRTGLDLEVPGYTQQRFG